MSIYSNYYSNEQENFESAVNKVISRTHDNYMQWLDFGYSGKFALNSHEFNPFGHQYSSLDGYSNAYNPVDDEFGVEAKHVTREAQKRMIQEYKKKTREARISQLKNTYQEYLNLSEETGIDIMTLLAIDINTNLTKLVNMHELDCGSHTSSDDF